jgi:hypothetical protein
MEEKKALPEAGITVVNWEAVPCIAGESSYEG